MDRQRYRDTHRIAAGLVLVRIIGEEIFAVRNGADHGARLLLRIVEQILDAGREGLHSKARDDLVQLALADIHAGDLRVQIAPVLLRHANVARDQPHEIVVHHAVPHQPHRRDAQAFLVDLRQAARERGRHRAADIGVVDVVADEGDELAVEENGLPHMHVGRMGRDIACIGVAGDADIALAIVEERDDAAIIEARVPGRAEGERGGDGQAGRRQHLAGEILRLLDESAVRGAHQRPAHAFSRGRAVVGENLKVGAVELRHATPAVAMRRLAYSSTRTLMPGGTTVVQSSCATMAGPAKVRPAFNSARR